MTTPREKPHVLCVDDEAAVLEGLTLHLRKEYRVTTAGSGPAALELLKKHGDFAVVISDLRMPEMSGTDLLAAAKELAPKASRVLLTGHSDMNSAIEAVNRGFIFRFLTKPCEPSLLRGAVADAAALFRLVTAEQDLLENTLRASVHLLTDILSLVNPAAFSCATRLREIVRQLCKQLSLPNAWQYEVAAMLSQIGCVTLAPDSVEKAYADLELSAGEQRAFARHPAIAADLIAEIPRLEVIAEMVRRQNEPCDRERWRAFPTQWDAADLGAEILRAALAIERLINRGEPLKTAIEHLRRSATPPPPFLQRALEEIRIRRGDMVPDVIPLSHLLPGMLLRSDVRSKMGLLLAPKGHTVTRALVQRLRNFAQGIGVEEPIQVFVRPITVEAEPSKSSSA